MAVRESVNLEERCRERAASKRKKVAKKMQLCRVEAEENIWRTADERIGQEELA